ncbi:hypothetical protein B0T24DRAFT_587515 [Lasiosphaeria ovina]|uniref:Uncharacterized protein n=1 Tax=Lasiosphaeria ovina TaxID=92902 RepID=A0AAE0NJV0_9PEZI|nr:hypothetical protein B0T24DRAFT_587515 [Lasiosphaeria ovina]
MCLLKKPALTPAFANSGVKSRYDDLVHLGPADSVVYNPQCLKRDLKPRPTDVSGLVNLMDYANDPKAETAADVTVADVMNPAGCGRTGALCYDHDKLYTRHR